MMRSGFHILSLLMLALGLLPSCRHPEIAVLYSELDTSEPRVRCPPGLCARFMVNEFDCEQISSRFDVVVLDGHSEPPVYLNSSPSDLARKIACMAPSLIVLDTCHGFSSPLLRAVAEHAPGALVVGSTDKIWMDGLEYDDAFFESATPEVRARHVIGRLGESVYQWHPNVAELDAMQSVLDGWSRDQLQARLVNTLPNLVRVPSQDSSREVVFVVPPERFK